MKKKPMMSEKKEPKREERKEAKLPKKAQVAGEKLESMKMPFPFPKVPGAKKAKK